MLSILLPRLPHHHNRRRQAAPADSAAGPAGPRRLDARPAVRQVLRRATASVTAGGVMLVGLPAALGQAGEAEPTAGVAVTIEVTRSVGEAVGQSGEADRTRAEQGAGRGVVARGGLVLAAQPRTLAPSRAAALPFTGHRPVPRRATPRRHYKRISPDARRIVRYTVKPGDTPSALAVRFHAWTSEVVALNGPVLRVGDRVRIPVVLRAAAKDRRAHSTAGKAGSSKAKKSKAKKSKAKQKSTKAKKNKKKAGKKAKKRAAKAKKHKAQKKAKKKAKRKARIKKRRARQEAAARPSRSVVRRVVARTARRHGVDPQLALAVAWQESGWQMHLTSSAGAIGAMQVIPSTGRWMSDVVGRRLHLRDLRDNATAGVVYLELLRSQARRRVAIAGYYQGLAGVRRHGMYDDTKRYVANVLAIKRRFERGHYPA